MVEALLNWLIFFLVGALIATFVFIAAPQIILTKQPMRERAQVPAGWTSESGRWRCNNISSECLAGMLRSVRGSAGSPVAINIEPPFAEVVWR
jgi:hypothetical protein